MSCTVLHAKDLHYRYPGGVAALNGLDLRVHRHRRLAILGPNGAGKSTLLLHLNGTLKPAEGAVHLDGACPGYGKAALAEWRERVGLVFQDPDDMLFAATVFEDVSFGPLNMGLTETQVRERVDSALSTLGISDLAERPTHMLSFGQKKRVAIAGVAAMRPQVMILDEPTAGLDPAGVQGLLDVLEVLESNGTTLVFATHDVDLAYAWADEVALFHAGRVALQGRAEAVLGDRDLLAGTALKAPVLLDMALDLIDRGVAPPATGLPRNRADFVAWMTAAARPEADCPALASCAVPKRPRLAAAR